VQRRLRQAVPLMTLALVGYTNAGKSTLFNRLTGSGVHVDARMFATLDPTVRQITLPSRRRVLLSDTVGFIRNLPTTLVEAFRATLEEVTEAGLLIHVVDASSSAAAEHCAHVRHVLAEIGAESTPQLLVLNKSDRFPADSGYRDALARRLSGESGGCPAAWVSARTAEHLPDLLALIDANLPEDSLIDALFRFPLTELAALNLIHSGARVLDVKYTEEACEVHAEIPESLLRRLAPWRTKPTGTDTP